MSLCTQTSHVWTLRCEHCRKHKLTYRSKCQLVCAARKADMVLHVGHAQVSWQRLRRQRRHLVSWHWREPSAKVSCSHSKSHMWCCPIITQGWKITKTWLMWMKMQCKKSLHKTSFNIRNKLQSLLATSLFWNLEILLILFCRHLSEETLLVVLLYKQLKMKVVGNRMI